jgi:hypothetical protein
MPKKTKEEPVDMNPAALHRKNLENIARKLARGGTLTTRESALLDERAASGGGSGEVRPPSLSKWSVFWRVSRQSVGTWNRKHLAGQMPRCDDVTAMLAWEKMQVRKSPEFAARCKELRIERGEEVGPPPVDEDWVKFREGQGATDPKDHKAQINTLEMFRDGYAMKLDDAMKRKDMPEIRRWNELLIETTNSIRQNKLAAEKLGLDQGDIISFAEMDRIIFAFGYWSMRAVDQHLDAIAAKLADLSPGFDKRTVRAVLEPELLSKRILVPFAKASKPSGVSLPARAVAKLAQTVGDFLEDGEALLKVELAKPAGTIP